MGDGDEPARESESIERALQSDLLAGFGRWSDEHADRVRRQRAVAKRKSTALTQTLEERH